MKLVRFPIQSELLKELLHLKPDDMICKVELINKGKDIAVTVGIQDGYNCTLLNRIEDIKLEDIDATR